MCIRRRPSLAQVQRATVRIDSSSRLLFVTALTAVLSGCSDDAQRSSESPFVAAAPTEPASDAGPSGTFAADKADGGGGDAGAAPKTVFYANTDTTLYQLDPDDLLKPMVKIGDFDCVGPGAATSVMTDIAVDKSGKVYGVSPSAAWPLEIKNGIVHCETKWPLAFGTHFNGLTFAPENTVEADEVLVGGNATGQLYRIDKGTGVATQIGTLGTDAKTGLAWTVSGDMVFLANGGNPVGFATVRTCSSPPSGCTSTDTLLEIDVKALKPGTQSVAKSVRGVVNRGPSCSNTASPGSFGSMFGIVAYRDKVFGFSRHGDFIQIDNNVGSGCLVWSRAPDIQFAGAGITTIAPVIAPPAVK
jgi:hypothetical protein